MFGNTKLIAAFALAAIVLGGCAGTRSFTTAARAGDTVALAVGWNKKIARSGLTVTFTPPAPALPITYAPGDPNVRVVANLYPDPVSMLIVGTETQQTFGTSVNANLHGNSLNASVTAQDRDYAQTMVVLNLPPTLPVGATTISFTHAPAVTLAPVTVDILPGTGSANPFQGSSGSLTIQQLAALEREATAKTITFSSSGGIVPHAIHVEFNHTAGVGKTWVVNPRGDMKNVVWTDTGSRITAMLTPVNGLTPLRLVDYKFFVAGGIAGLAVAAIRGYDINGNLIPGIAAVIQ